ncbi:uncharacterized protein LY89DRAFT_785914 [Mollisia scopiformis]|uniref:Major facilitator superfamily (MFS) profile domain-containing protein n=1 Tax=Mollisia scopiformis TaxID=149040 RepID=A0A194WX85_MOLSC|nr:uncharacterized protein LY89DRAFT_785914 [Mollisia scopiformis]KUJ12593.1 hypothetical protein LY89DRAFT_785914 [Mollisia scopiformis]
MGDNSHNAETTAGTNFDPSFSTLQKSMAETQRETDSDASRVSKTRLDGTHDEYVTGLKLAIIVAIGRAVAGVGTAGVINGAITIISSCVPLRKRPALIGLTIGVNQLGIVLGQLLGGVFSSFVSWRWCFYINLPFGALMATSLTFLRIPEQTPKARAIGYGHLAEANTTFSIC